MKKGNFRQRKQHTRDQSIKEMRLGYLRMKDKVTVVLSQGFVWVVGKRQEKKIDIWVGVKL